MSVCQQSVAGKAWRDAIGNAELISPSQVRMLLVLYTNLLSPVVGTI